jgi:hypothetical protein
MPAALILYFQGMSSLRSAGGSSGAGFVAAFLAFAGFLTAGLDRAGADGAGNTGKALGDKTVGSRSRQPGTLSRSIQPTILITGL